MSRLLFTLLLVVALALITSAQTPRQSWGEAANGLQMSISHDDAAEGPNGTMRFRVEFRNVGQQVLMFHPGELRNCGRDGSGGEEILLSITDSEGKSTQARFVGDGPPYASCFGEWAPLVVSLPAGASFFIPLDIGKYVDLINLSGGWGQTFRAGTYTLQAQLRGDEAKLYTNTTFYPKGRGTPWTGTALSNRMTVRFIAGFRVP